MNAEMAKRLAARRRAAGLSQEALAEKLGVSRQAVSKWERSESSPDTDNLIALAHLYGVSLDDLLYADVEEGGPAAEEIPADAEEGDASEPAGAEADAKAAEAQGDGDGPHEDFHIGPDGIFAKKGEDHVSVSWRDGIHVIDGKKGDTVHVDWSGVHVNDRRYESVRDLHERAPHCCCHGSWPPIARAWMRFPFPVLVALVYLLAGLWTGAWLEGLFLVFTIPLYYAIGAFIGTKSVSALAGSLYATGVTAWFCYMAFILDQPHPAWISLLTIPLVCALIAWAAHTARKQKKRA